MYDTEGNKDDICIHGNSLNCRQPHEHIHLKEKKQVLIIKKWKKLPLIENLRVKSLTCFKHQINIIVVLLSCGVQVFSTRNQYFERI